MTNEQAKAEINQLYMMLSEKMKMALDVLMAQADGEYISKSDMIDWLKDIKSRIKPQNFHTASEFEIAENQIWNLIQMLQMGALPSVAIPNKVGHWIDTGSGQECSECHEIQYGYDNHRFYCGNCGARMIEPQERSE